MACGCHITSPGGRRWARQDLEPHLASVFSHLLCVLACTLFLISLSLDW